MNESVTARARCEQSLKDASSVSGDEATFALSRNKEYLNE